MTPPAPRRVLAGVLFRRVPGIPVPRGRLSLRLLVPLLALPLAGGAALSDVRVLLDEGQVSIHSKSAPLAEILSRFAQATGAQVVYDVSRPRQLVSVVIEAASPAEAIAQLLEGQGLNYALRLDPSGRNVEMLVITGNASPSTAASAGTGRAARMPAALPPEEAFEVPAEEEDQLSAADSAEGPDVAAPPAASTEDATSPAVAPPFAGAAPGALPGGVPSGPETLPPAPSALQPAQPQPPAPASYPGGPPIPSPPVYPGPASYPG